MAIRGLLHVWEDGFVAFWCPGCEDAHRIPVATGNPAVDWKFNGNYDRPTFQPSILVRGRDFTPAGRAAWKAWCDAGCPEPAPKFEARDERCHSFVSDGEIAFLPDCTHSLAGQTVPLESF